MLLFGLCYDLFELFVTTTFLKLSALKPDGALPFDRPALNYNLTSVTLKKSAALF